MIFVVTCVCRFSGCGFLLITIKQSYLKTACRRFSDGVRAVSVAGMYMFCIVVSNYLERA